MSEVEYSQEDIAIMACMTCGREQAKLCSLFHWKKTCRRRVLYDPQYFPQVKDA